MDCKVTVLIPTYNRADPLKRSIDSVLSQTFEEFELLIVDDGSTDNTCQIVSEYEDNRIRYVAHDKNKGQNYARNTGIKHANGTYISYLDSDDTLMDEHLSKVVDLMESSPSSIGGVITGSIDTVNGTSTQREVYQGKFTKSDVLKDFYENIGGLSLVTFRASAINQVGYHDTSVIKHTDLDFYLQLLSHYDMIGINEPLVHRHKDQDSITYDSNKIIHGGRRLLEKYGTELGRRNVAAIYHDIGVASMAQHQRSQAFHAFLRGIQSDPTIWYYYYHCFLSLTGKQVFNLLTPRLDLKIFD